MYSWENIFLSLLQERRTAELKQLSRVQRLSTIATTLLYFFPALLQTATFSGAIYYNGSISLGEAFLILNIFRILAAPFTSLPSFVGNIMNFMVAMNRIQSFLLCDEIDENLILKDSGSSAFEIKDSSNFHWGFEKEEKKKVDKKAQKSKKDDDFKKLKDEKPKEGTELATPEAAVPEVKQEFILKNLDLTVQKGEFVCIIGPIGSGKSSLLSTIIGDMIYSKESIANKDDPTASEYTT